MTSATDEAEQRQMVNERDKRGQTTPEVEVS